MRQYWRDFESLERWTRSEPHRDWWKNFLRDSGGTGFWHETYALRGGFEAIYDDMPQPIGMMKFAPLQAGARQHFLSAPKAAPRRPGKFADTGARNRSLSRVALAAPMNTGGPAIPRRQSPRGRAIRRLPARTLP